MSKDVKVTMTKEAGGHHVGDVVELDAPSAEHLIDLGYATEGSSSGGRGARGGGDSPSP